MRAFDLHGLLAAPSGGLRPGFSVSEGDSHLSERAYSALDAHFLSLLEDISKGIPAQE